MMKTKTFCFVLFLLMPFFAMADIQLDKNAIRIERSEETLLLTLPFQIDETEPLLDDLFITLLYGNYNPFVTVQKKVAFMGKKQEETFAIPLPPHTPEIEKCYIRIDFRGYTWLKQFSQVVEGQDIHLIGQQRWIAGSKATLRVIATRSDNGQPIENALVKTSAFGVSPQHEFHTNRDGVAQIDIAVPQDQIGNHDMALEVSSPLGTNTLTSSIEVVPGTRIFLSTDKPVYQPNQLMHIRALAAHKASGEPLAQKKVLIEIFDGKGNKVFKQESPSSEFGIVSADFQLADEVNQGDYKITATLNEEVSEKTVQVYEYVLPKFRVNIKTKERFYAPGDRVTGSVEARYFFGKPVAGAKVSITANCFDVGFNEFAKTDAVIDEQGHADYSFTIPDRLVGQPQFQGNTLVQMDVRVRDTADHEEQKIHTFHVAVDPLQIDAIPESGSLIPGVENEIFLVASTPDGSVAKPELTIHSRYWERPQTVQCDENGIASIRITPPTPSIADAHLVPPAVQNVALPKPDAPTLILSTEMNGKKVTIPKEFQFDPNGGHLLLRVDKGVYQVGQTAELTALSTTGSRETVFLDVIKNNQTHLTKTMRLQNGRGSLSLPLDNTLAGSLTLNAYLIDPQGTMIRDTRQVVVLRSDDLTLDIATDQLDYQPGQPAQIRIAVTNPQGEPVRAALGMHLVDESVYSLSEKEPGLAKVFFAIERELMQPKVEIHGYDLDKVVRLSTENVQKNDNLSKALLAKLDLFSEYTLNLDTNRDKQQKAQNELERIQQKTGRQILPVPHHPMDVAEALLFQQQIPNIVPTIDPWGRPYKLVMDRDPQQPETETLFLVCEGRDGQFGTSDDLRVKNYARARLIYSATEIFPQGAVNSEKTGLQENAGTALFISPDIQNPNRARRMMHRPFIASIEKDGAPGAVLDEQAQLNGVGGGYGMGMAGGMGMMGGMGKDDGVDGRGGMAMIEEGIAVPAAAAVPLVMDAEVRFKGKAVDTYGGNFNSSEKIQPPASSLEDAPRMQEQESKSLSTYFSDLPLTDLSSISEQDKQTGQNKFSLLEPQTAVLDSLKNLWNKATQPANDLPLAINGQVDIDQLRQQLDSLSKDEKLFKEEREKIAQLLDQIKTLHDEEKIETKKIEDSQPVRIRRYFPETLYYTPEAITDDHGLLTLNLPMADSITTWRMSAMANAKSGALGDATAALKVFKPFFVDLDLPVALIQSDEVTLPVAVYNYLPDPQEVNISLERSSWFTLLEGEFDRTVRIAANEVTSVTYRIRAEELGRQPITVYARGSNDNDAIGKSIEVRANGSPQFITQNGRLTGSVNHSIAFPEGRVPGADRLFVKIYPGFFSQVVEGLDAILQMPYGCFEQTSSTTYPNILALQYMKQTGKITPEIEMKAREYINLGYQRLLTFEIEGGGFQVFGTPPATRILSAYGLLEFTDMSQVHPVDANVIQRTQNWLLGQMQEDGTWQPDENYAHAEMWKSIQDNKILSTAYVAMALAQTGAQGQFDVSQLERTKTYLLQHADEAQDAYTVGILCNALLALDRDHDATKRCVQRLVDLGNIEGDQMHWDAEASMSFARDDHASVEATAWAVLALLDDGRFSRETEKALNWIIDQKDPNGTWGTTHGTVLALKALIQALGKQSQQCDATVLVHVNGKQAARLEIKPENSDLFRQLDLTSFAGDENNEVEIDLEGEGNLLYQVVGKYFVPWKIESKEPSQPFDIQVQYDRSELRRNDTVTCQIAARNQKPYRVEMVMIDVGIPPGFRVEQPTLDEYVETGTIAKYSLTPRQMLIYLESMNGNQTVKLDVPMKATLPMVAKAPESSIYEYYNPEQKKASPPQELEVK